MPRSLFRTVLTALVAASCLIAAPAFAKSRIKDIVSFEGVRENQLIGYGIVVGLNGTGDSLRNAPMTKQSLEAMLERQGVNVRDNNLNTKNTAAVMVTANLPPFSASGSKVDVTVSTLGDAKSLLGGTLLVTSLQGADGQTYAVAQGTVQTGSVSAGGASGSSVTKGVPTAGRIAGGGVIERETGFQMVNMDIMRLTLRNPDFTTARRIADAINAKFPGCAQAQNPTIIATRPPPGMDMISFMTNIENLMVEPDGPAKVVIDEVAGVIVMGDDVRISQVAIAQGNLTITVQENPAVSQPAPFSQGQTAVVPQSTVNVEEEKGKKLLTLGGAPSLKGLIGGLNALGVTPRDMISILQAVKAAGALQADIEVM
ncbi:flagellar basal body P-ring protein FlgI [Caulobacter sp. SL161]|uniref:flagellar basal body P-ring protein FlgI n=1 Tax=Caulobacter sp. SL161 TaxID=2995156 RepID=UPI00227645DE|nr:flagellar basal body P-ring protein FlgI [Caulobacter sp. SL161]MCY1648579.1 flagellar basal body P-ring protein FlgI [Caulobacter sp. SL161]